MYMYIYTIVYVIVYSQLSQLQAVAIKRVLFKVEDLMRANNINN